ncbi:MAG: hypothetical protein QNJ60_00295 [Xenococcaceae cyanobacterium MO_188.B19]|nr:hypothetical protein [Xenococcaceae cyanobacterium MO_188.B19]
MLKPTITNLAKYQNKRDEALLELSKYLLVNQDDLPKDFIQIWQEFKELNNQEEIKKNQKNIGSIQITETIEYWYSKILNFFLISLTVSTWGIAIFFCYAFLFAHDFNFFETTGLLENESGK